MRGPLSNAETRRRGVHAENSKISKLCGFSASLRLCGELMAAGLFCCLCALASGTTAWEMTSYNDFIKGKFSGISLSREGRLTLAPQIDTVFSSDQPVIWAVAPAPAGA